MVYTRDLKSLVLRDVRVRLPPRPPFGHKKRPHKLNARKAIFSGKPEIPNPVKNERPITHAVVQGSSPCQVAERYYVVTVTFC